MFLLEQFWFPLGLWVIAIVGIQTYVHVRANNPNIDEDARIIFIKRYWRVFMLSIIGLTMLLRVGFFSYEQYKIREYALEVGIYEFEGWAYFSKWPRNNEKPAIYEAKFYFMVCRPFNDGTQLLENIESFLEKSDFINDAIKKYYSNVEEGDRYEIALKFYQPSKKCPPGWRPYHVFRTANDFEYAHNDYTSNNHIFTIEIPYSAKSKDDYIYYAGYQEEDGVTEYKRVTQEDGSFILLPVE